MQSVESNILKISFSITAGQPPECEQSNDNSCPQLEVLRGRDGRDGRDGERGEKGETLRSTWASGTSGEERSARKERREGRTTCPRNQSKELVYSGRAGGSWYSKTGGATNYLCMPDNPDYLQYDSRWKLCESYLLFWSTVVCESRYVCSQCTMCYMYGCVSLFFAHDTWQNLLSSLLDH